MGFWSLGRSENWEWIYWAYIGLAILNCPLGFNIPEGKTRTLRRRMTGPRSHTFMGRSTCLPWWMSSGKALSTMSRACVCSESYEWSLSCTPVPDDDDHRLISLRSLSGAGLVWAERRDTTIISALGFVLSAILNPWHPNRPTRHNSFLCTLPNFLLCFSWLSWVSLRLICALSCHLLDEDVWSVWEHA